MIVDEEHDNSYKQGSGLRYHGRDVAVLRGKLDGAMTLLGSATPSLESFYNASTEKFHLLKLTKRANQGELPDLKVIEPTLSRRTGVSVRKAIEEAEIPVHENIVGSLRDNYEAGLQSIVIVNRRGFAYFVFSRVKKQPVQCPSCSVSMTVHRKSFQPRCHYCDYGESLSKYLNQKDDEFLLVGYGSEQAEQFIANSIPGAKVVRVDSDTVAKKGELEKILGQFRSGEIDVLVGTQILAKGHDFPKVTLICLLEVDQMLNLPDIRAGERTFQLIVQAAGRAGRADRPGRVLMQTAQSQQPAIAAALDQDFQKFFDEEMSFRQKHHFPPFAKMVHFEFNAAMKPQLDQFSEQLEGLVKNILLNRTDLIEHVQILGPTVPAIERVRNRWRRTLLLSSHSINDLRVCAKYFLACLQKLPKDVRMIVDVDPQSIA